MKVDHANKVGDGWWTRKANGDIHTHNVRHMNDPCIRWYTQALIDMGAEWFPEIPDGYRLATAEDRKGEKPDEYMFFVEGEWKYNRMDKRWLPEYEYAILIKQEPKRVEFECDGSDFFQRYLPSPCYEDIVNGKWGRIKVTLEPAEDSAHGMKARETDQTGGENR